MILIEVSLKGAYLIKPDIENDELGFLTSTYNQDDFKKLNLNYVIVQSSISSNKCKGTLRGMHYQEEPHAETKLVQCLKGSFYDVIIDLRPDSSTYCQWASFELNDKERSILYIPKGFAHGFQTLEDDTVIYYQMSEYYAPQSARGVRWNDPVFNIDWPISNPILSDKDRCLPDFVK